MKKEVLIGIVCGFIVGIIDLIPMFIQKLPWNANLSALSMWIIIGFFISTTNISINFLTKGIIISILIFLPNSFIIGEKDPSHLIPIVIITIILGGLLSIFIQKMKKLIIPNH